MSDTPLGKRLNVTCFERADVVPRVELQAIKRDRAQLTQQLQQAQQAARPVDLDSQVEHLASKAWALIEELQRVDPARVRELLRQAIERIELRFTATQQGKRQIYLPTGGKVVFRPLSGFANRGNCRSFEPCLPDYVDVLLRPDPYLRQSDRLTRQCA